MIVAIYGSRRQDDYLKQIERFLDVLAERGDEAVMHGKLYKYLLHIMPRALKCVTRVTDNDDFEADYAVSIGGDGSFLRTAAWVGAKQIPIIGVNTGHLGFLATMSIEELYQLPGVLAGGHFRIEPRNVIEVVSPRVEGWPFALNEVCIGKSENASIVEADVCLDDIRLANYRADGLIISTPTGSTAYNLSVGGPIVQSSAPVFVISPIAAHSLSMRPFVVDDASEIAIRCNSRTDSFRICVDGRYTTLGLEERVVLRKGDFAVNVIQLPEHNFARTLREKLGWS